MMKKKFTLGLFVVLICLIAGCATTSRTQPYVPLFSPDTYAIQPGDPVNLFGRAAEGSNGIVAAAKPEASQVGVDILKQGGNAVEIPP